MTTSKQEMSSPEELRNERGGCRPTDGLAQRYAHPEHHQLPEPVGDSHEDAGDREQADPNAHDDRSVQRVQGHPVDESGSGEGVDEGGADQDLEVCALSVISPLTRLIVLTAGLNRSEERTVLGRVSVPVSTDLVTVRDGVGHVLQESHSSPLTAL